MEDLAIGDVMTAALSSLLENTYRGRRVLVTGHNGFVGSWLSYLLASSGASVSGYALADEKGGLAESLELSSLVQYFEGDIADRSKVAKAVRDVRPEIVFHLAAQALVLPSYEDPIYTWATNVVGTAAVLEALRLEGSAIGCVVITSDKCYATASHAHVETDALGGDDPYSASKAGAELVTHSYRQSFFADAHMGLATARAGNIVGGGDWAPHRIVPDCVRAILAGEPLQIRHPDAVRPWQHVLDAVGGYIRLGDAVVRDPGVYSSAWNFGPPPDAATSVGEFVNSFHVSWRADAGDVAEPELGVVEAVPERSFLTLDSAKARSLLGWDQLLDLRSTIDFTVEWYSAHMDTVNFDARRSTQGQFDRYLAIDASRSTASERHAS